MSGTGRAPLFEGKLTHPTTKYVGVPIRPNGTVGLHIGWKDATSSTSAITLELSSFPAQDAPVDDAGSAWEWKDSGVAITGPSGATAGSTLVHLENVRARRARLKIITAAACDLEIHSGADL